MDSLDRDTLSGLAQHLGWPAVTIHLPTHRAGSDKEQDRIRFKNLLRSAEEQLHQSDMRPVQIETFLRPAKALLEDAAFWRDTTDGLALYLASDTIHTFKVDEALAEHVMVGERFSIRPLLSELVHGNRFFVLTLSKNRVRLLEGTRDSLDELDLTGVPESMAEALKYDDYERNVQFHSRTPSGAGHGRRAAVFHGHGGTPDTEKGNLERYFKMIDHGIHDLLRDADAPLLLAGVDYLTAMYREANSYPHLVEETLSGSPDDLREHDLHTRARELLGPHFRSELDRDAATLEELVGTDNASADLSQIVPAAREGRVRVLFVSSKTSDWGRYDPSNEHLDVPLEPEIGDWDLADLATAETLLHGGTVYAVDPDAAMTQAAAIFRY